MNIFRIHTLARSAYLVFRRFTKHSSPSVDVNARLLVLQNLGDDGSNRTRGELQTEMARTYRHAT